MNTFFKMSLGTLLLAGAASTAVAGQEHKHVTESRPVDARTVRVKVEGLVSLKLRQGDVAKLVITGDPRWVSKTVAVQKGDSIHIDTDMQNGNVVSHKSVSAELTLPHLREVVSESLGSTDIRGFSGSDLHLALDGAGSIAGGLTRLREQQPRLDARRVAAHEIGEHSFGLCEIAVSVGRAAQ